VTSSLRRPHSTLFGVSGRNGHLGVSPAKKGLTPLLGVESNLPPIKNPERGPAIALANEPQKVFVLVNTFIPRPDLGPNAYTFVAPPIKCRLKPCRSCNRLGDSKALERR
jgi:hypothetical protein